jgi:hypothetical protein
MQDSFEPLQPLETVLRDQVLPALGADTLVVPAGQRPAGPGWLADPGWSQLIVVMPVATCRPRAVNAFLSARRLPEDRRDRVLQFTPSRPLTLALVAETLAHDGDCYPTGHPTSSGRLSSSSCLPFPRPVPDALGHSRSSAGNAVGG